MLIALAPHGPAPRSVPQVPLCPLPPVPGHALVSSRCCLLAALAETRPWAPLVSKGPRDPVVARWPGPRRLPRACLRVPACEADGRQLRPPRSRRGHSAAFPRSPGSEPVFPRKGLDVTGHSEGRSVLSLPGFGRVGTRGCSAGMCRGLPVPAERRPWAATHHAPQSPGTVEDRAGVVQPLPGSSGPIEPPVATWPAGQWLPQPSGWGSSLCLPKMGSQS